VGLVGLQPALKRELICGPQLELRKNGHWNISWLYTQSASAAVMQSASANVWKKVEGQISSMEVD